MPAKATPAETAEPAPGKTILASARAPSRSANAAPTFAPSAAISSRAAFFDSSRPET